MSDLVENEVVSSPNVQEPVVVQEPVSTPEPTVVRPVQEVRSFETVNTDSYNSIKLDPLFKKKLGFLGLMQQIIGVIVIIDGALYCLPIVTAILGVPFIIIGLKMFKSGGEYKKSLVTLEGEDLKNGLSLYSDAIKIALVVIIVLFTISLFGSMYFIGAILSGALGAASQGGGY